MVVTFIAFLKAVLREYVVLLTGGTLTAVLGLIERHLGRSVSWSWYCVLLLVFVVIACFRVWEKEHEANRNGTEIYLEWIPSKAFKHDEVCLRNVGNVSATQVTLERFSWPEISFVGPLVINAIHPNQSEVRQPHFVEKLPESSTLNVGHLSEVLRSARYKNREPLQVFVTFRSLNRTVFERAFVCEPGPGGDWGPLIKIAPGKLTIKRV